MELRALIVEDDLLQLDGLELAFRSIPEVDQRRYGVDMDKVFVEKADCAAVARRKLEEASVSARPFDILIQDLNLPNHSGEKEEGVRVGLDLLKFAYDRKAAREICIVSAFHDFDSVSAVYDRAAVDFIPKDYESKDLPRLILRLWERRLMKESARILDERIKTLVLYAEREFIHKVSSSLSRVVQTVLHEVEGMKSSFSERLGIDPQNDPQDPLLKHLAAMRQAIREAPKECGDARDAVQDLFKVFLPLIGQEQTQPVSPRNEQNDRPVIGFIEDILREVVDAISPSLTVKRVRVEIPEERKTQVVSFGEDAPTVLREIALGGVAELPEQNDLSRDILITVDKIEKDGKAEVRFVDNMSRIPHEKEEEINSGMSLPPDGGLGRAWGLSVIHQVAKRSGGHLNVESSEQGNIITYFIPLAKNA
jgi:DNA-binding NarL/FixJ family response regulator